MEMGVKKMKTKLSYKKALRRRGYTLMSGEKWYGYGSGRKVAFVKKGRYCYLANVIPLDTDDSYCVEILRKKEFFYLIKNEN